MNYLFRTSVLAFAFLFTTTALAGDKVSPTDIVGATTINANTAKELFDNEAAFIDVRKNSDWEAGRIPSAIHLELKGNFTEATLADEIDKNENVVFYCNGEKCMRSSKAAKKAVDWGYTQVYYYRDGFPSWKAAGYPVE